MNKCFKTVLLIAGLGSMLHATDDGPRMYWNAPVGTNILQAYFWDSFG